MSIFIYSLILIAISVTVSTIINIIIMRQVAEIAAKEVGKIEERIKRFLELMTQK
ncbi:hypothetical protein [Carnobacterium antarcticum]|uniref:Uncharacterized protein n=1 Tax=Carnobacterium antarcticum TaxID=2126436 RepID=A0ABW4NR36_9LACT|nr:hypothetical protein [Carnobacterium sp. CP1]